ncbi:MAG: hypothetical protein KatS3mg076_1813 [Candidatus Binatia bacterium]|nr:MAG: hypothetical protein KatS3mg076_1813 [Candidatus Binatia bacterium]
MNCEEIRERLEALVDGELAPSEAGPVEEHVRGCTACGRFVENRRVLRTFLRTRLATRPTPESTRKKILEAIEKEAEREVGWLERLRRLGTVPGFRVGLAVAAAALLVLSVLPWRGGREPLPLDEVASRFLELRSGDPALELRTESPEELRAYYTSTGTFPFRETVPDFRAAGFRLLGGGLSRVGPHRATLTLYEGRGGRVLCQRFSPDDVELPPGGKRVGRRVVYEADGVRLGVLVEKDFVCVLATDLPEEAFGFED